MASTDRVREIYAGLDPWVILATSTFITASALENFNTVELLRQPFIFQGQIGVAQGRRVGQLVIPAWFPVDEAILEEPGGAFCTKVRDLPLPLTTETAPDKSRKISIDLSSLPLSNEVFAIRLSYSPWYRFLTEPISFEMMGRVASYVGDAFLFLLAREGHSATMQAISDGVSLSVGDLHIECVGQTALRTIRLRENDAVTAFHLDERRIEIDRRMFAAPYVAGAALLNTSDRLQNVDLALSGEQVTLKYLGKTHV